MSCEPHEDLCLRRILVAVDGSPSAELALRAAITVARRDRSTLTLICVAPDVSADISRWALAAGAVPATQDEVDAEAAKVLREAVERVPHDVPVTTIQLRGKAGPTICAHAAARDYDAILLGARGVGRVGALTGSVSGHVLHHADTAVFVAHAPRAPRGDQGSARSADATATP